MTFSPPAPPPVREPASSEFTAPRPPVGAERLVGPDVVRAVALIGVVVMNYHGYLIILGGERSTNFWGRVFDPWQGPLSTRFAATFVLVAGAGVTLLTRRSIGNPPAVAAKRWTLLRRGLLLYGFGLIFYEIWAGSILPYYGAMFIIAAAIFTLSTPLIIAIGVGAALAGAGIEWWGTERAMDGRTASWLYSPGSGSPRGLVFDMFVNGTHPLLPWLAFLCAGIVIGRALRTDWWQPVAIGIGFTLFGTATLLEGAFDGRSQLAEKLSSTHPLDRGLLYTASALGTALIAFTVIYELATRFRSSPIVTLLAHAGQMSLTLYVIHALVFNFIVNWRGWGRGWVEPAGLDLALTFAAVFWIIAIAAGSLWHRRFGIGPIEWVYRKIGA
jgi:uncharacterized protein